MGYFLSESTMFTSLPPRRLRWSAGAAGRSSPNRVPAPYSRNVTSRTCQNRSQSGAPGPKTNLQYSGVQWWLKTKGLHMIKVTRRCQRALDM